MLKNTHRLAALLVAAMAVTSLTGCVERTITIGSDPSGAIVLLNDQEIGRTPITVPFTWYGDYDVRLRYEKSDGTPEKPHVTRYYLHTHKETKVPPFEFLGIDFFSEVTPIPFKDEQVWAFAIPKVEEPTNQELIDRAHDLKDQLVPNTQP